MKKIQEAQEYLRELGLDGWLLYDFHKSNELAHRFCEIPEGKLSTRRFFYWIPAKGEPVKVVHAIEESMLDQMPGKKRVYSSWQMLESHLEAILRGSQKIAMEYSPRNAIPYVSKVDAGTVDLVRSFGVEVVSSGSFLLYFTAVLSESQIASQGRAAKKLSDIVESAWDLIGKSEGLTEKSVQSWILEQLAANGLTGCDGGPIVAVNAHSADPHYSVGETPIQKGDFILIDLWAKETAEGSIFGDITRVAVLGEPTQKQKQVFGVVRAGQKAGIDLVKTRFAKKERVEGWEVDEAVRTVIRDAGYGDYFIHRTGHSIEVELHGSGTHMDNLEMHDVRPIVPGTCFSVEPGIYLPGEFGVRLESDVVVLKDGKVLVTGGEQDFLLNIGDKN